MRKQNSQLHKYARRQLSKAPLWVTVVIAVLVAGIYLVDNYFNAPSIPEGQLEVHFIDVGQGDSQLLSTADGAVLVDAGTTESQYELSAYLKKEVTQIDYMILSHPHEDHIGGAAQVIEDIDVKNVIMPDAVADSAAFERLLDAMEEKGVNGIMAEPGAEYSVGDLKLTLLGPLSEEYDNLNNYSIFLRADYGEDSFMFSGDAESLAEREVLEEYTPSMLDCDVFKVGHHGSNTSNTADFLDALTPDIAVIGVGADNDYGHPTDKVLSRLAEYCDQIYRTDLDGTVVLLSEGQGVTLAD